MEVFVCNLEDLNFIIATISFLRLNLRHAASFNICLHFTGMLYRNVEMFVYPIHQASVLEYIHTSATQQDEEGQ